MFPLISADRTFGRQIVGWGSWLGVPVFYSKVSTINPDVSE